MQNSSANQMIVKDGEIVSFVLEFSVDELRLLYSSVFSRFRLLNQNEQAIPEELHNLSIRLQRYLSNVGKLYEIQSQPVDNPLEILISSG